MPPPPNQCALCGAHLSPEQINRAPAPAGTEGAVWKTVCPSCGRLWITTAAWDQLLAWLDDGPETRRRAASVSEAVKRHNLGQVVPVDLRFVQEYAGAASGT